MATEDDDDDQFCHGNDEQPFKAVNVKPCVTWFPCPQMKLPSQQPFALDLSSYTLRLSRHAQKMAHEKNFTESMIQETYRNPTRVYPSGSHPGQYRVAGNGLCLVGLPEVIGMQRETDDPVVESASSEALKSPSRKVFTVVTIYQDNILTPPRTDQLDTEEGRRYAERYLVGLGRG